MRSVLRLTVLSLINLSAACAPEGSSAYVTKNLELESSCKTQVDGPGMATGQYDVSGTGKTDNCVQSYFMNLLVNSNLKSNGRESTGRAEPNVLLITHADVRLMDKNQATLTFKSGSSADPDRPNPYRVRTASSLNPTTGGNVETTVVPIEAIPKAYAEKLSKFDGDSILLEVQLFGTTTGDVDVDIRPFLFPVAICRGCLSKCASGANDKALASLTAGMCTDNHAQDGRYCLDRDCADTSAE